MDLYIATEEAYKRGYADGRRDAVKHGLWVITEEYSTILKCDCWRFTCSVCKDYTVNLSRMRKQKYCPNCGSKMDLEW